MTRWERTADRSTFRALADGGAVLTVSRSAAGGWLALAERNGAEIGRDCAQTRLAAQAAAERIAGGAS